MQTKTIVALGCGIAVLVGLLAIVGIVAFVIHASQDVEGVSIAIECPDEVLVGETFQLKVAVTNERPADDLELSDIDIADEFLDGFLVSTVEPQPKSNMHVPIDNSRSYTFDVQIPPGQTRTFTFALRAEKPGIYRGDVDVCEGLRYVTEMAQIHVKEK